MKQSAVYTHVETTYNQEARRWVVMQERLATRSYLKSLMNVISRKVNQNSNFIKDGLIYDLIIIIPQ